VRLLPAAACGADLGAARPDTPARRQAHQGSSRGHQRHYAGWALVPAGARGQL
jgi:hypothetical protein